VSCTRFDEKQSGDKIRSPVSKLGDRGSGVGVCGRPIAQRRLGNDSSGIDSESILILPFTPHPLILSSPFIFLPRTTILLKVYPQNIFFVVM
jgi:hypothetical protein